MPGPDSLCQLGCLHPLQGPLGLLPVLPDDPREGHKAVKVTSTRRPLSRPLPAWTLSPRDHFFPSCCPLPGPGQTGSNTHSAQLVRALEGEGQTPAPWGPSTPVPLVPRPPGRRRCQLNCPARREHEEFSGDASHTISSLISPKQLGRPRSWHSIGPSRRCSSMVGGLGSWRVSKVVEPAEPGLA